MVISGMALKVKNDLEHDLEGPIRQIYRDPYCLSWVWKAQKNFPSDTMSTVTLNLTLTTKRFFNTFRVQGGEGQGQGQAHIERQIFRSLQILNKTLCFFLKLFELSLFRTSRSCSRAWSRSHSRSLLDNYRIYICAGFIYILV